MNPRQDLNNAETRLSDVIISVVEVPTDNYTVYN